MKQNLYDNSEFFAMYKSLRETRVTYNDFIEQPAMKKLLPGLEGLNVLDLGCGFGELAHYCINNGASHVTGVDLSEKMLGLAKKDPHITFVRRAMEEVQFDNGQFDLVVSSLAFHYIEDINALMGNISKWIKPIGYLVFSIEHPVVLSHASQTGWVVNSDDDKLHWPLDNYSDEGVRTQFWGIDGVIKYHRKLSTLLNLLTQNDFVIQQIDEPEATPEGLEKMPKLISEKRRPSFLLVRAMKKGASESRKE